MRTIKMLLILALLLASVTATVLPALLVSSAAAQPAVPIMSIDETAPAVFIACDPPPCDCSPDC